MSLRKIGKRDISGTPFEGWRDSPCCYCAKSSIEITLGPDLDPVKQAGSGFSGAFFL